MNEQHRHRGHETKGRTVHGHRDARREQIRLLRRIDGGDRRERADEPHHRAEKSQQRCKIGKRCEVVRALLEARHDLHEALFHRLLDVVAAARRLNAREPVIQDLRDRGVRLRGDLHHLAEVALGEQRHDVVPQVAVLHRRAREIDVAFDRDREPKYEHDGDRIHEIAAALKEPNNEVP
jgi:hypothetical protein